MLSARVVARIAATRLSVLEHERGRLEIPSVAFAPGATIRLCIHARDVALARSSPSGLSIRDVLQARQLRPDEEIDALITASALEVAAATGRSWDVHGAASGKGYA